MALREEPYKEALDALLALDGVGDKVVNCVLLFPSTSQRRSPSMFTYIPPSGKST